LEINYAAGIAALRARDWPLAISAFENVLEVDPNFREASRRLREAKNGLKRESTDTILAHYYADGVAAMSQNDFASALAAFEKVHKLNPHYREVASLMAETHGKLRHQAVFAAGAINVDSLYQQALAAAGREEWMQAVVDFEKVQLLWPGRVEVAERLAEARAKLAMAKRAANTTAPGATLSTLSIYLGGAAALLILPLLGFAAFSPATRARLQCLRGNYAVAAQIYEKVLARNPDKVKLYPALANIYLLLGRNDESALKIYKTVLQLNLATHHREEMNVVVAQKYLVEGRTDSEAIEILEGALKAEQRRQQSLS
jgi:tetratricopeptide (TPR) repeat protein